MLSMLLVELDKKRDTFFSQYECLLQFVCFKMLSPSFKGPTLCFRQRPEIKCHALPQEAVLVDGQFSDFVSEVHAGLFTEY